MIKKNGTSYYAQFQCRREISLCRFWYISRFRAGIIALEIQQSSDTTYRFYDFDRIDAATKEKRPLQIEEALAVTTVPHVDPTLIQDTTIVDQTVIERLVVATKFTIDKLLVRGPSLFELTHHYELFTVIEGSGFIDADQIKKVIVL